MPVPAILKKRKFWLVVFGLALAVFLIPYRVGRHEVYPFGLLLLMTALEMFWSILLFLFSGWIPFSILLFALLYWLYVAPKFSDDENAKKNTET